VDKSFVDITAYEWLDFTIQNIMITRNVAIIVMYCHLIRPPDAIAFPI